MTNDKLYYTGSTSYCRLTDYSCRKLGVPVGSSFSMLDASRVVYCPCKTGGRDNTGKQAHGYELICRNDYVTE